MSLDEDLSEEFIALKDEWKAYCDSVAFSSNPMNYIDCKPYRRLVAMGEKVLPYIHQVLIHPADEHSTFPVLGWFSLVQEITGNKLNPPRHINGMVDQLNQYARLWLAKHKYTSDGRTFPVEEDTDLNPLFNHVLRSYPARAKPVVPKD